MKGLANMAVYAVLAAVAAATVVGIPVFAALAFFTFAGAVVREQKALGIVRSTLMQGEALVAAAVQKRVFALFARRAVIAITSSRIIIVKRGLLGGFKMTDVQWKDLKDVTLEENVLADLCGSNLRFEHLNPAVAPILVEGVASETATVMYARAQGEEQAWEEKRRVRAMEEVRAAAGGVVVHAPAQTPHAAPAEPGPSRLLAEIQEAKKLLDAGTISDAEFQEMKSKILSGS